jgi:response regulator RpfG family c-di-GMP phosphodiesterase
LTPQVREKSDAPIDRGTIEVVVRPVQHVLQELINSSIVIEEDWERLASTERQNLMACSHLDKLLSELTRHGLLTRYQAERIETGCSAGLILGNYRIIERLGAGGMSVVFKAEQLGLRRDVAIKVLTNSVGADSRAAARFTTEMRAVARLQHPNIVAAIDAGKHVSPNSELPPIRYFVMEYVPGQDLDEYVRKHGPLPISHACDLIHQIASALEEARKHNLVHRDIKPSNIRVTPQGQAKLVDFGLARRWDSRQTQPGSLLGTIDFMAPEQVQDAGSVDIRADIYALGATLYWCLTAQLAFPARGTLLEMAAHRITQCVPSARVVRPEIPRELDEVIARMTANKPDERFQTPRAVMRALLPFVDSELCNLPVSGSMELTHHELTGAARVFNVLIVDDSRPIRDFCRMTLQSSEMACEEAGNGLECLEAFETKNYDLVLLDIDMPEMSGLETLRRLRANPANSNLKIIMFSGRASADEMAQAMFDGADDYLTKPFSCTQLQARVRAGLKLKLALERLDFVNRNLTEANRDLERVLAVRNHDLATSRNAIGAALAGTILLRSTETPAHLRRMRGYCRRLAEEATRSSPYASQINAGFIEILDCCVPFHDIGAIGLPEYLVMKPGKFTLEERLLMQTHTTLGAEMLQRVANEHGYAPEFFQMAVAITRHHHERFDGSGYPDGLAGTAIPLAARIVAIADVFDALRSRRFYKPPLPHNVAVQVVLEGSPGQFDPALIDCFRSCQEDFDQIFRDSPDSLVS